MVWASPTFLESVISIRKTLDHNGDAKLDTSKGIYAGLSGINLESSEYSLGLGLKLTQTYAHLMAPFMMAFSPAEPGRHHPAPWSAVSGGLSFDIQVQLEVPPETLAAVALPPEFVPWWITALLRLRIAPVFLAPVVGEQSFEEAKKNHERARYYPIETNSSVLSMVTPSKRTITELDAAWVARHWVEASRLFNQNEPLQMLFESVDQSMFSRHRDLALLWLWGGLEALFSSDKTELKYRISSGIASFLEPAGVSRMNAQKGIAKLYDSRSAAAHALCANISETLPSR